MKILKLFSAMLMFALSACSNSSTYTLYRNSVTGPDMRIHVATFNAAVGDKYNWENCSIAAGLFQSQPGVAVKYWCEKGSYRP